jgi:copper chaperone CopZ
MMCQRNCGSTVERALRAIPGCTAAHAVFAEQTAMATFTSLASTTAAPIAVTSTTTNAPNVAWETLCCDAIESVGFDASVVQVVVAPPSSSIATAAATAAATFEVHLHVTGMMCQRNCGTTVQRALLQIGAGGGGGMAQQQPQCRSADVSYAEQRAVAVFAYYHPNDNDNDNNDSIHEQQLQQEQQQKVAQAAAVNAIECVGFDAEIIPDIYAYRLQHQLILQQQEQEQEVIPVTAAAAADTIAVVGDDEIVLQVRGMSCAVCTGRVERALQRVVDNDIDKNNDNSNNSNQCNRTAVCEFHHARLCNTPATSAALACRRRRLRLTTTT